MRTLAELTTTDEPAWPWIAELVAGAPSVRLLPRDPARADADLLGLQITVRSPLGALVHGSGGLLVDRGWLRILGSGSAELPRSVRSWNTDGSGLLLVADDVVGGFFAINGGALDGKPGEVFYLAPDTLEWESLERGFSDFLAFALSPAIEQFYESWRYPGWEDDIEMLGGDEAFMFYPFLWADGPDIAQRVRKPGPIAEIYALALDMRRQLNEAGSADE